MNESIKNLEKSIKRKISQLNSTWFSLTFQSNKELNNEIEHAAKTEIALILIRRFNAINLSSKIRGNIIFCINNSEDGILRDVYNSLTRELLHYSSQPLLMNICKIGKDVNGNPLYIESPNEEMNNAFQTAIHNILNGR
ncbi:MAG: hypothetical protein ACT6QS_05430 [Flavobacteriales bacterium]